jgi:hypothetical protein
MMREPLSWPMMVLPIKKRVRTGWPDFGVLRGDGPTVYLANMYELGSKYKNWADIETKTYDSFEAIVEDGWVVD